MTSFKLLYRSLTFISPDVHGSLVELCSKQLATRFHGLTGVVRVTSVIVISNLWYVYIHGLRNNPRV